MFRFLARDLQCVWRMKNAKQTQVDEEMGYFFGFPKGTYSEVLRQLGRTRVNSCQTSSIPLAEFWQPANLATIQSLFAPHLPGFDPAAALKLQNMKFLVFSVPITNAAEVERRFKDAGSAIFDMLREESVYEFDFVRISTHGYLQRARSLSKMSPKQERRL